MLGKASILIISIALSIPSYSQYHLLASQFCKETDNRGYDGNYSGYVVRIYNDSTIEIHKYFIQGMIYNAPVIKTTYAGKFIKVNDTFTVFFLSWYTERKEKLKTIALRNTKTPTNMYWDLPVTFFIQNGVISTTRFLFPDMPACTDAGVRKIETMYTEYYK